MPEERPDEPEDLDRPPSFFPYGDDDPVEERPLSYGDPVEVEVEAVFSAQAGDQIQRFVLLSDGERKLPIVIGPYEATAITLPLDGAQPDRPLTHDLIRNILDKLDVDIERILIDDLWGNTYYAKIILKVEDEEVEIDSRPSDAIALAVRFDAPIYVAEGILNAGSSE
jgi:bifunctional DNase/RNase